MKKIALLFFCTFFGLSFSYAQGVFKFDKLEHNFEKIKEGELATHVFEFTNTGNTPIVITRVKASCGCTTPEWTAQPIPPGQKGQIKAVYNSKNRPGQFAKSITITSNASEPTKVLRIKGFVEGDPNRTTKVNNTYNPNAPVMTLKEKVYNFGKLQVGQKVSHKFTFTNTGKTDLKVNYVRSACRCVSMKVNQNVVRPGETTTIELIYAPKAPKSVDEIVSISTNNPNQPFVKVILKGQVVKSMTGGSIMQKNPTNPFGN